jgi:hypothetical protein
MKKDNSVCLAMALKSLGRGSVSMNHHRKVHTSFGLKYDKALSEFGFGRNYMKFLLNHHRYKGI